MYHKIQTIDRRMGAFAIARMLHAVDVTNYHEQKAMRAKLRTILERAISDGITYGYHRAHKHTDTPSEELMISQIENGIWLEIDEVIDFEEVNHD